MKKLLTKSVKSQSILEYLITLTAIVIAIIIGTVGLKQGVQNGLDTAEDEIVNDYINDRDAPESVQEEGYYTPSSTDMFEGEAQSRDAYEGPQLSGGYYYHEGESNMDHVPEAGAIMDADYSFVAPPVAGTTPGDTQ
jgi:hypothetical protein